MASVEWGEYRVGDLFDIVNTPSFNKERLTAGDEYDYVTRTSLNQGILQGTGFVNESNLNEANVWSLGLLQMDFFYRKRKWYAGQYVRKIIPKFETTANNAKFFSVMLNKLKPVLLQVLVRNVDDTFKNQLLNLPTQNNQIDFDFMDSFIAELEAERIAELEAYLKVSGLDNYELSIEEQKALRDYDKVNWGEYKLDELFDIVGTKSLDRNAIEFVDEGINFIGRTFENNGIQGKIAKRDFEPNPPFTITATVIGNYKYVKFQHEPYYCSQNINRLTPKELISVWNEKIAYFLVSNIQKFVSQYNNQQGGYKLNDIKSHIILLPVEDNQIDFKFIEKITNAMIKLTIKGVVQYTDKRIEATKTVVAEHQKEESE